MFERCRSLKLLINKPRGWGKTMILSMLYSFLTPIFDANQNLFQDLKISAPDYKEECEKF